MVVGFGSLKARRGGGERGFRDVCAACDAVPGQAPGEVVAERAVFPWRDESVVARAIERPDQPAAIAR